VVLLRLTVAFWILWAMRIWASLRQPARRGSTMTSPSGSSAMSLAVAGTEHHGPDMAMTVHPVNASIMERPWSTFERAAGPARRAVNN